MQGLEILATPTAYTWTQTPKQPDGFCYTSLVKTVPQAEIRAIELDSALIDLRRELQENLRMQHRMIATRNRVRILENMYVIVYIHIYIYIYTHIYVYIYRLSSSTFTLHGLLAGDPKMKQQSLEDLPSLNSNLRQAQEELLERWEAPSGFSKYLSYVCWFDWLHEWITWFFNRAIQVGTGRSPKAWSASKSKSNGCDRNAKWDTLFFLQYNLADPRKMSFSPTHFFPQVAGKHSEVEGGARGSWNLSTPHRWGEARELQELQRCSHDTANLWSRTVVMKEPWRLIFVRTGRGVRVAWGSSKAVQYRFGASKWPRSLTNALFKLNMLRSSQWS